MSRDTTRHEMLNAASTVRYLRAPLHAGAAIVFASIGCGNGATVPEPDPLVVVLEPTHVTVHGGSDGAIDLTVSGGVEPYSHSWSNGDTTEDIGDLSPGTYAVTVTEAHGQTATDSATIDQPLISTSGVLAFSNTPEDDNNEIYVVNADGGNLTPLTDALGVHDDSPTWSPDGTRIAFGRAYPQQNFRSEVWIMSADGTEQRQIGSTDGGAPDWSPDGSRIAFHSDRSGDFEIYVINADGTEPRRLTSNAAPDVNPDWSPDGTRITFTSMRDGNWEVYVMNADGTGQHRLTDTTIHAIQSDWRPIVPLPTR